MRIVSALAKLAFAGFAAALLLGLAAGFGKQLGLWNFGTGFEILKWAVFVGLGTLLVGIVWLIWALIAKQGESAWWGAIGLAGAVVVVAIPLHGIYTAKYLVPPIHDITTDIANPPQFGPAIIKARKDDHAVNSPVYYGDTKVTWKGKTLTVAQWQRKSYPDIFTVGLLMPRDKLYARALKAAKAMGWHIVLADEKDGRINASDTTFFFGFTDDIAIRVAQSGAGAKLDIRSESRVGISDIGTNAARIRAYIAHVKKG